MPFRFLSGIAIAARRERRAFRPAWLSARAWRALVIGLGVGLGAGMVAGGSAAQTPPAANATSAAASAPAPAADPAANGVIDEIAVIVNNGMITRKEVRDRAAQLEKQLRGAGRPVPDAAKLFADAMDELILERVQIQEATETGLKVNDDELDKIIAQIAQRNQLTPETLRPEVEKTMGLTWARYREQLRGEVEIARLREREVVSKIQVYDNEVDAFIAERTGQTVAHAEEFHVEQILVPVPEGASAERRAQARERATTLLRQLRDGAAFPSRSSANSDIQVSDLGYRTLDRLPKVFADTVVKLKKDEINGELVESPAGWHILRLVDRRIPQAASIRVPQVQLRRMVLRVGDGVSETEARRRLAGLAERVRNGGDFTALARQFSQDPSAARGGELGWVALGDIPPDLEVAIRDLKPGQLSEPVRSGPNMTLLQVVARREAEITAEQQRDFARAAIRERKIEQAVRDWLRQMRENAYIDYRGDKS